MKFLAHTVGSISAKEWKRGRKEEGGEEGRKEAQKSANVLASWAVSSVYRKQSMGAFRTQQSPSGILQAAV